MNDNYKGVKQMLHLAKININFNQHKKIKMISIIGLFLIYGCQENANKNTANYLNKDSSINTAASKFNNVNANNNNTVENVKGVSVSLINVPDAPFILASKASQFLTKATFGPTESNIQQTMRLSSNQWLNAEFAKPATLLYPHAYSNLDASVNNAEVLKNTLAHGIYKNMITAPDQLRQRMTFALSQIFVVSSQNLNLLLKVNALPSYYDMLTQNAFGNYRKLLESITLHPAMGAYLNIAGNQKADGIKRIPDENYAREIMQLFSIGLYELNQDASIKLINGKPIETYTNEDISGLAKVFTGWNYANTQNKFTQMMQNDASMHSNEEKRFLNVTIPANTSATQSLKIALDTLFNHPNTAPFICKQLIQRFVTSNPSPAYILRIVKIFNNNGLGVKGDLKAVLKAILTDNESLNIAPDQYVTYGKIKEPILRFTHLLRAFDALSTSGKWLIGDAEDLGQNPLTATSVFNFYRPSYIPSNSYMGNLSMHLPEMQISNSASMLAYYNFMNHIIENGVGYTWPRDIQFNWIKYKDLAKNSTSLISKLNLIFTANTLKVETISNMELAINKIIVPSLLKYQNGSDNQDKINQALLNRIKLAVNMVMIQPEYITQK